MPQITVFNLSHSPTIIDCYIISNELFSELASLCSVFQLNQISLTFLEELQKRFLLFLNSNFDSENAKLQALHQFPWYLDLIQLLESLYHLDTDELIIELTYL
ncbi:MAG: hypothetical protein KME09_07160 [Pleurocapsa minor HA4230-MV1]|jgi:hypothetical protein|nr:hypothetical protein [Pleurocapsa minor HA4230-MV1]